VEGALSRPSLPRRYNRSGFGLMPVAFYVDEHVPSAVTRGLRRRGVDVLRVQDDAHANTDDELILDRAAALGRVVFTQDQDFLAIAQFRQVNGVPFAGVVFAHQDGPTVGQCVDDLETIAIASDLTEWENRVEYLPL
jgi:predicted nuclease of predicted toxin-antitoxin system